MDTNSLEKDIGNIQGMYGNLGGQHQPSSMQEPPNFPKSNPTSTADHGQKKAVLMKLMQNLFGKQGRSFHELSNGIKQALGTYKNFAKEWDTLNGVVPTMGGAIGGASSAGASGIQKIMQNIQQKKAAGGASMGFSGGATGDGSGGPGYAPQTPQMRVPPTPQPAPPAQSMPQAPAMVPQQSATVPVGTPPQGGMPSLPQIAGPAQTSSFNRPAPVNSLGIHGY